MRLMRWASELAVGGDADGRALGLAALTALDGSALTDTEDRSMIRAVLLTVMASLSRDYAEPPRREEST